MERSVGVPAQTLKDGGGVPMSTDMLVLAILGSWLVLSVLVCVAMGFGIRQADAREAVPAPGPAVARRRRSSRPLSVA
jgi:hypothetical protein